jgi:UDP-N-acetylmuramoyl-tripeptide--D-alanyl-D-alanine ligase
MTALWTADELERATLGRASKPFAASGVSINSREIAPGDLYIAIKGEKHDGHDFVRHALDAGAAGALVSKPPRDVGGDAPLLMVAHAQKGLEDLGSAARARSHAQVLAVTGSVGKTTVKEMLRLAFGACGATHASSGSLNNHWGVPLTLARMPRDTQYAVIEIGMNHFGEIRALNTMVRPHLALITTIAPAHIEYFGNVEAIADAKAEIFESLMPGAPALLPADSPQLERLMARAKLAGASNILSFGERGADARLLAYAEENGAAKIKCDVLGLPVQFTLNAPGRHNALGAVAVLLAVAALSGDVMNAAAALKEFAALRGRGARLRIGGVDLIDESYNANPASMAAALGLLQAAPRRRIAVLGDMLELGGDAAAFHAGLKDAVTESGAGLVFLCGPHMRALWDVLPAQLRGAYVPDSAELAPLVAAAAQTGDTILVKGSNGSRMTAVIDAIKAKLG